MVYTVWGAVDRFRTDEVDLDPNETKIARASRDYLVEQIKTIAKNNGTFPRLGGPYRSYGPFARRTKIRPLNDIDLLLLLSGTGAAEATTSAPYIYQVKITDSSAPLAAFAEATSYFDTTRYVNSTKLLNAIKSHLVTVPTYGKATIKRTGEAVTLNLSSRTWAFDIVPAVGVAGSAGATDSPVPSRRGHSRGLAVRAGRRGDGGRRRGCRAGRHRSSADVSEKQHQRLQACYCCSLRSEGM